MIQIGLQSMFYQYVKGVNGWSQWKEETTQKHDRIVSCRKDSAALQVVVAADEPFLLTTSNDPVFWKKGSLNIARVEVTLEPSIPVEMRIVQFVEDDDRSLKPDIISDVPTIYVEEKTIQPIWLECLAAADAIPGDYIGTVRLYTHNMFEDEQLVEEVTFELQVKDRVLPDPKDYRFILDLWQHNSNIARKYDVELWRDEHFNIIDAYLKSLADLGQKSASVTVSEIPWSGQRSFRDREPSDLFEYSMIRVYKRMNGQFDYDYSALDRYIELAERHGMCAEIEVHGLLNIWQDEDAGYGWLISDYPDGVRIRYYDEAANSFRFIRKRSELDEYIHALYNHFDEKNWIKKVRIAADEPDNLKQFEDRIEAIRMVAPNFKYKMAINLAEFAQRKLKHMHDYSVILNCVANEYKALMKVKSEVPGHMLIYVCCLPNYPNTFVRSPSVESRLIPWMVEKLGFDGFLRWNYTVWPDDPLNSIQYRPSQWKAGDTNFVYPGKLGKPLLSLRYKWLQRGIRDFEIIQQLKLEGQGSLVDQLFDEIFLFKDPRDLMTKRPHELYSMDSKKYDKLFSLV